MIDSISGGASETESFVSGKNTNVDSVQFVIKTDAIEKPEEEPTEEEDTQSQTFLEKLLALFGVK